jgi:hypothetical protein
MKMDRWWALEKSFAECHSLPFIDIPRMVGSIRQNRFESCFALSRLTFGSIKKGIDEKDFDETLEKLGLRDVSSVFRIEVNQGGIDSDSDLKFTGWPSIIEGDSRVPFVRGI